MVRYDGHPVVSWMAKYDGHPVVSDPSRGRLGHSVTQRHSVHVSHSVVQGLQKHKHQDKEKSVSDQQVAGEVIYKPPF